MKKLSECTEIFLDKIKPQPFQVDLVDEVNGLKNIHQPGRRCECGETFTPKDLMANTKCNKCIGGRDGKNI